MAHNRGFIAINRGIFDHWVARNPKRFKAWQWLIAEAAHVAQGRRGTWGVVHVERAQMATSIRILARQWRWPKSNVGRFLKRLAADGMIETKIGTSSGPASGIGLEHAITILSICNYDQFQTGGIKKRNKVGQQAGQRGEPQSSQQLALIEDSVALTTKPLNQESLKGQPRQDQSRAPKHGTQSSKHKTVYLYKGTEEWRIHAQDYRDVIGAEPLPDRNGAFWFYILGEAVRPAHQRYWSNAHAKRRKA